LDEYWPGALTFIFEKNTEAGIADEVTAGGNTIGLRMPDSPLALEIIKAAGTPVAAPSANISGARSASSAEQVIEDLCGRVDMIIDGGDCPIGISSTIIDASAGDWKVLRQGSINIRG